MEEKKQKGGYRPTSGRKPTDNPKEAITVYLEKKFIEETGGKDKVRDLILKRLKDRYEMGFAYQEVQEHKKKKQKVKVEDFTKPPEQPETNHGIDAAPKTLEELKALCQKELDTWERGTWIRIERQKYGF